MTRERPHAGPMRADAMDDYKEHLRRLAVHDEALRRACCSARRTRTIASALDEKTDGARPLRRDGRRRCGAFLVPARRRARPRGRGDERRDRRHPRGGDAGDRRRASRPVRPEGRARARLRRRGRARVYGTRARALRGLVVAVRPVARARPGEKQGPPPVAYRRGRSPFRRAPKDTLLEQAVPVSAQISGYKGSAARRDVLAGVTVAALALPSGMAYAEVAGLSPVYGLYALLLPAVLYTLLGSSRQLIVGPEGAISALVGAAVLPLAAAGSTEARSSRACSRCSSPRASSSRG